MHELISKIRRRRGIEALELAENMAANLERRLFAQVRKAYEAERAYLESTKRPAAVMNIKERHALETEATRLNTIIDVMLTAGFAKVRIDETIRSAREQEDKQPKEKDDSADN